MESGCAQHMARPTEGAWRALTHLTAYLKGTKNRGIVFEVPKPGIGLVARAPSDHLILAGFSDADLDWMPREKKIRDGNSSVL